MNLMFAKILPFLLLPSFGLIGAERFDHTLLDELLQTHVKDGLVNYRALKKDSEILIRYLGQLERLDPDSYTAQSEAEQKALWINSYNAITLAGIIRNYPIRWGSVLARVRFPKNSIRQIGKFWDTVFIKVMGRELTLNQIEHDILRKQFQDPRIHFAIVCASMGCPILQNHAYTGEALDAQLEAATREFIQNSENVHLDRLENILYLSSIFDWYKEDFFRMRESDHIFNGYNNKIQGVLQFLENYFAEKDVQYITANKPKIKFLDYDWTLNEQLADHEIKD